MLKRHLEFAKSKSGHLPSSPPSSLPLLDFERHSQDWLFEGEFRSHSPKTIETHRIFVKNLLWFLKRNELARCGKQELKAFFVDLGKPTPEGRWDIPRLTQPRLTQPLRPVNIKDYHHNIKIMFRWFVSEGFMEESPMETLPPPLVRASQIQPRQA
jgi:hypothetical protein